MSRECCSVCLRAQVGCICHLFTEVNNETHVVILQHPNEVKQTKGTVTLLANSLARCEVIVGENFNNDETLAQILSSYKNNIALLYPSDNAIVASSSVNFGVGTEVDSEVTTEVDSASSDPIKSPVKTPKCIILIDGTWKKSYKMYMLNEALHHILHLTLPDHIKGDYRIRKTQKEQALSSLEACSYALSLLENNVGKYETLLKSFSQFNDLQLSFKPNK